MTEPLNLSKLFAYTFWSSHKSDVYSYSEIFHCEQTEVVIYTTSQRTDRGRGEGVKVDIFGIVDGIKFLNILRNFLKKIVDGKLSTLAPLVK